MREVCLGLGVAHLSGIVHRDLKPANLFHADVDGATRRWKILDFGVSKVIESGDATLTTNQVLGTPHYMSPEQAARRPVDARSDLYGLGAIAYRVITGKLAFPKSDVNEVIRSVLDDMPEDPRGLATMPEDVALWLRRRARQAARGPLRARRRRWRTRSRPQRAGSLSERTPRARAFAPRVPGVGDAAIAAPATMPDATQTIARLARDYLQPSP